MFVFQHPVDVSYETGSDDLSTIGMPRIELEVRWLDAVGRSDLGGYAVAHVPATLGVHEMSVRVWRPRGSLLDRFATFFIGGAPQLKDPQLRYGFEHEGGGVSGIGMRLLRSVGRQQMSTAPCGELHLRLSVCRKRGLSGIGGGGGADDD